MLVAGPRRPYVLAAGKTDLGRIKRGRPVFQLDGPDADPWKVCRCPADGVERDNLARSKGTHAYQVKTMKIK